MANRTVAVSKQWIASQFMVVSLFCKQVHHCRPLGGGSTLPKHKPDYTYKVIGAVEPRPIFELRQMSLQFNAIGR